MCQYTPHEGAPRGDELASDGGVASLAPSHSHFLLLEESPPAAAREADGAPPPRGGIPAQARADLEDALCSASSTGGSPPRAGNVLATPMVTMVVGGDQHTLELVLATLRKAKPVVVLADCGGAACDLARFWRSGELPAEIETFDGCDDEPTDEGGETSGIEPSEYDACGNGQAAQVDAGRAAYVTRCSELLPLIKEAGTVALGANRAPMLSFFETGDDADGAGNNLETVLLEAVLSDCERPTDAIMYAVAWGTFLTDSTLTSGGYPQQQP